GLGRHGGPRSRALWFRPPEQLRRRVDEVDRRMLVAHVGDVGFDDGRCLDSLNRRGVDRFDWRLRRFNTRRFDAAERASLKDPKPAATVALEPDQAFLLTGLQEFDEP